MTGGMHRCIISIKQHVFFFERCMTTFFIAPVFEFYSVGGGQLGLSSESDVVVFDRVIDQITDFCSQKGMKMLPAWNM